jgi:hypothetical protein
MGQFLSKNALFERSSMILTVNGNIVMVKPLR